MKANKLLPLLIVAVIVFSALTATANCCPRGEISFRNICFGPSIFIANVGMRLMPALKAGISAARIEDQPLSGFHFGLGYPSFDILQGIILWGDGSAEYDELKISLPISPYFRGLFPYAGFKSSALSVGSTYNKEYSFVAGARANLLPNGCLLGLWGEMSFLLERNPCGNCSLLPLTIECGIKVLF